MRSKCFRGVGCLVFVLSAGIANSVCAGDDQVLAIPKFPLPQVVQGAKEGAGEGERLWILSSVKQQRVFELAGSAARDLRRNFPYAEGLAFDGAVLWVAEGGDRPRLLALDPSDGRQLRTVALAAHVGRGFRSVEGLAWDGEYLWTAIEAGYSSTLNQVDRDDGSIVRSIYADCEPRSIVVKQDRLLTLCYNGDSYPLTVEERILRGSDQDIQNSRRIVGKVTDTGATGLLLKDDKLYYVGGSGREVDSLGGSVKGDCVERREEEAEGNNMVALLVSAHPVDFDDVGGAEFWYDLVTQYRMLLGAGFQASNIYVVFGDGSDFNTRHAVFDARCQFGHSITNAAATRDNIVKAFDRVAGMVDRESFVYIWWMGHGEGYGRDQCELSLLIGRQDEVLTDRQFSALVDKLSLAGAILVSLMSCHSGGAIADLRQGSARSMALASSECSEPSFSARDTCDSRKHAEFNYLKTAAVQQRDACGMTVESDDDKDKIISLLEVEKFLMKNMKRSSPKLGGSSPRRAVLPHRRNPREGVPGRRSASRLQ